MNIKNILIALIVLFCVGLVWRVGYKHQQKTDARTISTVLPSNDNEKISIDPEAHIIQIVTASGVKKEFLPGMRPSSVEIRKDGTVVVTAKQMGVEHALFAGVGFGSSDLRVFGGVDLLYFKRLDLGLNLSDATASLSKVRVGVCVSYNFWHDARISLGMDSSGSPNVFVSERI